MDTRIEQPELGSVLSLTRVVWAVDATASNLNAPLSVARAAKALVGFTSPRFDLVYVTRKEQEEIFGDLCSIPYSVAAQGEKALNELARSSGFENIIRVNVLSSNGDSDRKCATELLRHAVERGARLLAIHISEKNKLVLPGRNFAQTLVSQSPIPVLICNPKAQIPSTIAEIIFPTDFSPGAEPFLDVLFPMATRLGARLTLIHKVRRDELAARAQSIRWMGRAKDWNVDVNIEWWKRGIALKPAILWYAKKRREAILAMAVPKAGPLNVFYEPSALNLARYAPCPVLLHSVL